MKLYELFVNGVKHLVKGKNITVKKRSLYVDGDLVCDNIPGDTVKVEFIGDVASLNCTSCTISGDVKGSVDATSVKCGNVNGDVDGTSVTVNGNVGRNVDGTTVKINGNVGGKTKSTSSININC